MAGYKIQRIASEIEKEVSNILANEANDSLLKTITTTPSLLFVVFRDSFTVVTNLMTTNRATTLFPFKAF